MDALMNLWKISVARLADMSLPRTPENREILSAWYKVAVLFCSVCGFGGWMTGKTTAFMPFGEI
jgi:hypothetical protein